MLSDLLSALRSFQLFSPIHDPALLHATFHVNALFSKATHLHLEYPFYPPWTRLKHDQHSCRGFRMLNPLNQSNAKEVFVSGVFFVWLPWITDIALIFRVVIVYGAYSRTRLAVIIIFPVIMKLARAGVIIAFLVLWNQRTTTSTVQPYIVAKDLPHWIHECGWTLELIDNTYISALFLWQLASQGHIFNGQSVGRHSDGGKYSVTNQLRTLFWIASTNLIFPVIFGVIEIAFIFQPQLQVPAIMVYNTNIYVSVVSTVFASVWASTSPIRDAAAVQNELPAHNALKGEKLEPLAFIGTPKNGRQARAFPTTISVISTESAGWNV
ncbi:hypothetical protein BDZ89DRAFT_1129027 [Hymenopellis radicata]|nr:hypothetical protein BDZ89DRAFT_1129027 [Hymenopellis radicata]